MLSRSVVSQLFLTPSSTVACQAPLSVGIIQARILEWVAMPSSKGPSQPRYWTQFPALQADSSPGKNPSLLYQGSPVYKCRMFKREKKKQQCNTGTHVKPYLNTQHSFTQQRFDEQLLCQALSKASSAKLLSRATINSWKQLKITHTHTNTKQNTNEIQCSKALAISIQLTVAKEK